MHERRTFRVNKKRKSPLFFQKIRGRFIDPSTLDQSKTIKQLFPNDEVSIAMELTEDSKVRDILVCSTAGIIIQDEKNKNKQSIVSGDTIRKLLKLDPSLANFTVREFVNFVELLDKRN